MYQTYGKFFLDSADAQSNPDRCRSYVTEESFYHTATHTKRTLLSPPATHTKRTALTTMRLIRNEPYSHRHCDSYQKHSDLTIITTHTKRTLLSPPLWVISNELCSHHHCDIPNEHCSHHIPDIVNVIVSPLSESVACT